MLSGMYSLGGQTDVALLQQRVHLHPAFEPVSYKGIPDVRVILTKTSRRMAMLRLPTRASGGRANLHQGGLGAGIDLASGMTHHAVCHGESIAVHPDTGASLLGVKVPFWRHILDMSAKVAAAVGLGYVGVDIVVDADHGPMLLEANARPGLAIQMANGLGLRIGLRKLTRSRMKRQPDDRHETPNWRLDPKELGEERPHFTATPEATNNADVAEVVRLQKTELSRVQLRAFNGLKLAPWDGSPSRPSSGRLRRAVPQLACFREHIQ